jgi:hypothetical protein
MRPHFLQTTRFTFQTVSARSRSHEQGLLPSSYPPVRPTEFISTAPKGIIPVTMPIGVDVQNLRERDPILR